MSTAKQTSSGYGIGAVARMTGLSTHILRIWERRYNAVIADRAANGRRIYSPEDVEKLSLLKSLTDQGTAISSIANLSIDELRSRAEEMDQIRHAAPAGEIQVAVLGEYLPAIFSAPYSARHQLVVVATGSDRRRFLADLSQQQADVLVVETTNLDDETLAELKDLSKKGAVSQCLVVYRFARRRDEELLLNRGFRLLRAPVAPDEMALAIRAAVAEKNVRKRAATPRVESKQVPATADSEPAPPRRFTEAQLLQLMAIESNVDCECPRHLAEIIRVVTAFETYSRECENRNETDAALHAYLHRSTAQARRIMEDAMERLISVEGVKI